MFIREDSFLLVRYLQRRFPQGSLLGLGAPFSAQKNAALIYLPHERHVGRSGAHTSYGHQEGQEFIGLPIPNIELSLYTRLRPK